MRCDMRKNAMKNKLFLKSFSVFFAVLMSVFGLDAVSSTLSESLKDDVTAMITNAKKLPHAIFVIDTSESMNSFAFSDYIDNCADGISNLDKAIILCNNAYKQCRNVEENAIDCINLGCEDVLNKCTQLSSVKVQIQAFCDEVSQTYSEPDKHTTVETNSASAMKYVGPWNPSRTYTDDICFYDWSKDSDGNVLSGTTTAEDLNKALLGVANYPANATDRRDWDCLTDGKGQMYNSDGTLSSEEFSSVSGLWMNWKYATSLDIVKIILANTHKFSFPPRFRGQNDCHKTVFKPTNEYYESASDETPKKTCFVNFDTAFSNLTNTEPNKDRDAQLAAMKEAIASLWTEELVVPSETEKSDKSNADEYAFKDKFCDEFSVPSDIVMYKNDEHASNPEHPAAVAQSSCGRCMQWNPSSKSFEDVSCSYYNGTEQSEKNGTFGDEVKTDLEKSCCKTYNCTVPKCRDNDEFCKGDGKECVLGYYSEYDQDANHCCNEVSCAEPTTPKEYCENGKCCQYCESGTVMGGDSFEGTTGLVTVLGTPADGNSYAPQNSSDEGIAFSVYFSDFGITAADGVDTTQIESVKVTVYYGCLDEGTAHPSQILGTRTFSAAEASACAAEDTPSESCKISGVLKGCDDKGYRAEANVTIKRADCRFEKLSVSAKLKYELGKYELGNQNSYTILNPNTPFYQIFRYEASNKLTRVFEYECRAAFYHRQSIVIDERSCPSASEAPALINAQYPESNVEYCDGGSLESEVISRDFWGNPTKRVCSWQCRDSIIYDDPWKCASFFYMMDDASHNGSEQNCINHCRLAMGGSVAATAGDVYYTQNNKEIEDCCKCLDQIKNKYTYLEKPEKVVLSDGKEYTCAVSGYQFGTAENGMTTTSSGYMAEIIRGSINEAPGGGSYALQPYNQFTGSVYTDSPYDEWYRNNSLLYSPNNTFTTDSFISAFETANDAKRETVCIYDIMKYGWTGEDCNHCGTGCCAIDLSQEGNECEYPQFWMKIPRSDGGKHIYGAGDFSNPDSMDQFKTAVRDLKAIGGATLGETLYDVWRYLGGMYALYDPQHNLASGTPYQSPFESQDATCFTNEAVVISGGQPEFDHNDGIMNNTLTGNAGISVNCPAMDSDSTVTDKPCVSHVGGDDPTKLHPYYQSDWHQSSFLNVVNFAHANTFWGKNTNGCRTDFAKNALGLTEECQITENNTGTNKAIINRVHTVSIGEWGLAPLRSVTNAGTGDFLDSSYLKKAASNTDGKYYGLTAGMPSVNTDGGGTFQTLTELFKNMMTQQQPTDVVSGRPHWTSSLVQPFDVEEKYRGPEAYSAGAVPIDGAISRFWFGNLKKYEVDSGTECKISDDTESGDCGEWKKQTFPAQDCFGKDDYGTDFQGTATSIAQFKKLMTGGAAYKLEQKIKSGSCSMPPCYKSSPRTIFYDDGTGDDIKQLNSLNLNAENAGDSQFFAKFHYYDNNLTADGLNQIFDYMAGYDSFNSNELKRTNVRYSEEGTKTFTVQDPIAIDFNQTESSELTLRPLLLGAIIHSKPVAVYYNSSATTRIYAGANDGMLHAFDQDGNEVYAYIPSNAAKSILNFGTAQSGIFFNATVDGPITMLHIDQSHDGIINTKDAANNINGEKAYLIFGYRRGAKGYTVIDVSNPDKPKFVQNLNTGGGYSFGKAVVFRKCSGTCSYAEDLDYYLAVPGGYDTCHDPSSLTTLKDDNKVLCDIDTLTGNKFIIYKFDKEHGRFMDGTNEPLVFSKTSPATMMSSDDSSWLVTSFTSVPFAINTAGKAAVNTEFVYFTDLSGTVFRVDVRNPNMSNWTAKVVYSQRSEDKKTSIEWANTARSYVASNFFPPLERYNPEKNDNDATMLIPIPMITGNAANPKMVDSDGIVVFYDKKTGSYDSVNSADYVSNNAGTRTDTNGNGLFNSRGWTASFVSQEGEKGITEPLITYNIYGTQANDEKANAYSIAWNTYIPKKATECKNFGTSNNYERLVNSGKQAFTNLVMTGANGEWTASGDASNCQLDSQNISIATSVGVVATDKGYDLTFGAGADIFRKREMIVKNNKTYIIKWYELY